MDLTRFRAADASSAPAVPKAIAFRGKLLALDQTLASTGYAIFSVWEGINEVQVEIVDLGMLTTPPDDTGHLGNMLRGVALRDMVSRLIVAEGPKLIVHETPPRDVGKIKRAESSLLAGLAVRCAAADHNLPVEMIGSQKVKTVVAGDPRADKKALRDPLNAIFPRLPTMKPCNEHTYDAVGVGYTYLTEA